jgi:hypothetical protein
MGTRKQFAPKLKREAVQLLESGNLTPFFVLVFFFRASQRSATASG